MKNFTLRSLTWFAGICLAVACGGNSHKDPPDSEGTGGGDSGGKGGTDGKGGTGGKGGTSGKGGTDGKGGKGGTTPAGGEGGETPVGPPALTVIVDEAPEGATPTVTVTGPNGFSETITETTTFTDIEPGTYSVTSDVESARVDGVIVDSIFDLAITGSPAEVEEGETSIEVTWKKRPGTGMLWLGNYLSAQVLGYAENILGESNDSLTPTVILDMPALGSGNPVTGAIAFDAKGTLWVGYCDGTDNAPQAVAAFSAEKLGQSGSPQADIVIETPNDPVLDCVAALYPDPDGGLWVGFLNGGVVKYSAEQLSTSGAPTPAIHLTTDDNVFGNLADVLLDPYGNLWVAAYGSNAISMFTAAQITSSNPNITPTTRLGWLDYIGPSGITISPGPTPQLWASFYEGGYLAAFDLGITTANDPPESVSIYSNIIYFGAPEQLTFDKQGNLWVALHDSSQFAKIDADDLVTGDQEPSVVIGGPDIHSAYGIRFNPPAE